MCFSAITSFLTSAVILAGGIAALQFSTNKATTAFCRDPGIALFYSQSVSDICFFRKIYSCRDGELNT